MIHNSQKVSQISSSHRLIELTSQIRHRLNFIPFSNSLFISQEFFLNEVLKKIIDKTELIFQNRFQSIIKRIERVSNRNKYDSIIEVLYDNDLFKNSMAFNTRSFIIHNIKECIKYNGFLNLIIPIFSRKSLSPIKNQGTNPDLGEIYSLIRFYSLAKLITEISGIKCRVSILSDGNKYRRACLTPLEIINNYQNSLRFWIDKLELSEYVSLFDYEEWIKRDQCWMEERSSMYRKKYDDLSLKYDKFFDFWDLNKIKYINIDLEWKQLCYTFFSIITSVNYESIFNQKFINDVYFNKDIQNFYISFISSLDMNIKDITNSHLFRYELIGDFYFNKEDIVSTMRKEAWEASKRYVSISLVDREIDTLFLEKNYFLKCTIHRKEKEFNFISTSKKDYCRTAQHSVAGLDNNLNLSYRYRIERDTKQEKRIYFEFDYNTKNTFNPMNLLSVSNQPIYYISNIRKEI